jgi:hypothetical protein
MHPRHGKDGGAWGGCRPPAASVGGSQCLRLLVPPTPHQQGRGAGRSRSETASVRSPSQDKTRDGWHRGRQSMRPLLEAAPLGGIMSRSRFLPPSPASSRLVSINVVTTGSPAAQCAPELDVGRRDPCILPDPAPATPWARASEHPAGAGSRRASSGCCGSTATAGWLGMIPSEEDPTPDVPRDVVGAPERAGTPSCFDRDQEPAQLERSGWERNARSRPNWIEGRWPDPSLVSLRSEPGGLRLEIRTERSFGSPLAKKIHVEQSRFDSIRTERGIHWCRPT